MKNLVQLIITILFFYLNTTTTVNAQLNQLKGQGSDTMLPVIKALANTYGNAASINVEGGGSTTGFIGLSNYAIHFALSSRKVNTNEREEIEAKYDLLKEEIIAFDALSIIINPENDISKLSLDNLSKIFKGEITNWKTLGGKDIPIVVITRDINSGSYGFFKSQVLKNNDISNYSIIAGSNSEVVQKVSQQEGAIGYCGIAYIDEIVQPVSISKNNIDFIYPSFRNALLKIYPLSRPLYLYYRNSERDTVQHFVKFALSEKGQQIIAHKGYIPAF